MPDINVEVDKQINIKDELGDLALFKFQPNNIINRTFNRLTGMLNGEIELMDASNPFAYLIESSCLNTTYAVQEYLLATRKLYPRLANSDEDLYLHMSDKDYLGRFSEPADADMSFNIDYRAFKRLAIKDTNGDRYLTIPKHYQITIDKYVFTLLAPIVIRETAQGILDVSFDIAQNDPTYLYNSNLIKSSVYNVNVDEIYINFNITLPELLLESTEVPIEKNSFFKGKLTYKNDRQFYYFRAYRYVNNAWKEMLVTHTDQVYDVTIPTCVVKVIQETNQVEYYIPPTYINTNIVKDKVKFVIYSTQGAISVNFNDYDTSEFEGSYNRVFPKIDLTNYTTILNQIPKIFYIRDHVEDGKDMIDFLTLKRAVINNSIGDRVLPITEKQLGFLADSKNFTLLKDIDTVTNRIYLLEINLPRNNTAYDISRFNLDIIEHKTTINTLKTGGFNGVRVSNTDKFIIVEKGSLFELRDGFINPLTTADVIFINALPDNLKLQELNNNKYLSTYYHYVVDYNQPTIVTRVYDLEDPSLDKLSFDSFNSTAEIGISITNDVVVSKVDSASFKGYKISAFANVVTYNTIADWHNINTALYIEDEAGVRYFIEGSMVSDAIPNTPMFEWNLESLYEIDENDNITITNAKLSNYNTTTSPSLSPVKINLHQDLKVIFYTDELPMSYVATDLDTLIANTYLSIAGNGVISMETMTVKLGVNLERLYARTHVSVGDPIIEVYTETVYQTYPYDIWGNTGGSVKIIHHKGDRVKDTNNNDIILHNAGDPKPESITGIHDYNLYLNFMFIDYRIELATYPSIVDYRAFLRSYMRDIIVNNAKDVNEQLLENTESYVVVPKSISDISVKTARSTSVISSQQSFILTLYVTTAVNTDQVVKDKLKSIINNKIDEYLATNTELKRSVLTNLLLEEMQDNILSLEFEKFTELNMEYMELTDKNARIGINKALILDPTGYNIQDDITVKFVTV